MVVKVDITRISVADKGSSEHEVKRVSSNAVIRYVKHLNVVCMLANCILERRKCEALVVCSLSDSTFFVF